MPHVSLARDVDADGVSDRVTSESAVGPKVSVTDVLIRALGRVLAIRGSSDVGLAVATPDGVMIPVLPAVADRTLPEIADLRVAAVARARSRALIEDDRIVPAVTLSNLGTHGVDWFTGIIPIGQQGLLTVGTLRQRPVVRGDRLAVGWQVSAVLTVDDGTLDQSAAAELLRAFALHVQAYGRYADD